MATMTVRPAKFEASGLLELGRWFVLGSAVAFVIPYLFTSVWEINHDIYYGIYFAAVAAFLGAFIRSEDVDIRALLSANWQLSFGVGVLAAAFVVMNVLRNEDSTPHPAGLYFAFEVGWRGLLYGVVDALLLTAFPAALALAFVGGKLQGAASRLTFAAVALALTLVLTAVYHLGYAQFREDGVGAPEIGNTIISVPALVSANPVGSVVAHASMHVAAVTHSYETDTFLPPQTNAD